MSKIASQFIGSCNCDVLRFVYLSFYCLSSRVKLLVNKKSGDTVALKSINLKTDGRAEGISISSVELEVMIRKEMTIHVNLNHENIIKFYGSRMEKNQQIFMFLEYAQGGELYDRIGKCILKKLSSHFLFFFSLNFPFLWRFLLS